MHIVSFDSNDKITQIRLNWDQGSLLKLIDVIGKTGRNWPIRDGKDQSKLTQSSVAAAGKPRSGGAARAQKGEETTLRRSRENSTNVTRDPHASLALFAPRESDEDQESRPAAVPPRASAKPPARNYHDLFVEHNSENAPTPDDRPASPFKHSAVDAVAPKVGAGKNFQPSRIFDREEDSPIRPSSSEDRDSFYRPNAKKFQHFDLVSGTGADDAPISKPTQTSTKSQHGSSWNFDDFNTPAKAVPTKGLAIRGQDVRHWGNEDDEVIDSPIRKPKVDHPRKDAETHFEFQDDGTPEGQRRLIGRPRGAGANTGLGLYKNNLYDSDESSPQPATQTRAPGNVANVKDRSKDFVAHFTMSDDSPAPKQVNQKENVSAAAASPRRAATDKGPLSEHTNAKGINIAGDGMGSRKGAATGTVKQKGINIGGDGMGGKKGAGRAWGFGDDSDGEQEGGLNGAGGAFRKGVAPKRQGTTAQTGGGDFWDF